jgi:hypothetical protein
MPGIKPKAPNLCVLQDHGEPRVPKKRRTSRLFQKPKPDADAWCQLLEGIEEVGLLPQVLQHLEGRDVSGPGIVVSNAPCRPNYQ